MVEGQRRHGEPGREQGEPTPRAHLVLAGVHESEAVLNYKGDLCDLCGDEATILHNIKGFDAWENGLVICEACLNKLRNYLQATQ